VERDAGEVTRGRKVEVKSFAKIYCLRSGGDVFRGTIDFACAFDMGFIIQDFDLVFRVYLHDVKCMREDIAYSVSGLAAEAWLEVLQPEFSSL
jgi:hypothetical protein